MLEEEFCPSVRANFLNKDTNTISNLRHHRVLFCDKCFWFCAYTHNEGIIHQTFFLRPILPPYFLFFKRMEYSIVQFSSFLVLLALVTLFFVVPGSVGQLETREESSSFARRNHHKHPFFPFPLNRKKNIDRNNNNNNKVEDDYFDVDNAPTTRVGKLAKLFEPVLVTSRPPRRKKDIKTDKLFQACQEFASLSRKTGQTMAAKDLEGNIDKLKTLYRSAPKQTRNSLRSLLEYEIETRIHDDHIGDNVKDDDDEEEEHPTPRVLKDPSGALGGLWLRRSLAFQSDFYRGILQGKLPVDAALDGYRKQLEPYHGWALQKVYSVSLKSFSPPSSSETLRKLGGFPADGSFGSKEERTMQRDLENLVQVWTPLLEQWKRIYQELDLEDQRRV